jgi:hypothetical protein
MKSTYCLSLIRFTTAAAFGFLALGLSLATSSKVGAEDGHLDVNDVSFLWPVPKSAEEADALISLADEAADGPIMPPALFKALIDTAKKVSVKVNATEDSISFPDSAFEDPKTWKVAGIRINPTALGSNPEMVAMAEVPGIRLIVQPVLVSGSEARPQDFAAHVVFNYILPIESCGRVRPDTEAFGRIVQDLRQLKKDLAVPASPDNALLNVHPGFLRDPDVLTGKLRDFLKKHLASKNLDKSKEAAVSFMGIPGATRQPWIFFKVKLDTAAGTAEQGKVSGQFKTARPRSQMLTFTPPNSRGGVFPEPLSPRDLADANTAMLFPPPRPASWLEEPLFPETTNPKLTCWQRRDVADIVAHPQLTTTLTTDCVSCHTESTLRHKMGLKSQPGTAFALPVGISGVSPAVLPRDSWNLRNFGWGRNEDNTSEAPKGFHPTVSQRAANEAAESADFINKMYPIPSPTP